MRRNSVVTWGGAMTAGGYRDHCNTGPCWPLCHQPIPVQQNPIKPANLQTPLPRPEHGGPGAVAEDWSVLALLPGGISAFPHGVRKCPRQISGINGHDGKVLHIFFLVRHPPRQYFPPDRDARIRHPSSAVHGHGKSDGPWATTARAVCRPAIGAVGQRWLLPRVNMPPRESEPATQQGERSPPSQPPRLI